VLLVFHAMSDDVSEKQQQRHSEGPDIAKVLTSKGPIVKCVILRAPEEDENEPIVTALEKKENGDGKVVLTDLIEEIEIDTTPSKSMILNVLGGSFTFLGQYEEEGVVMMIRNIPDDAEALTQEELSSRKLSELRGLCKERDISMEGMLEKRDLILELLRYSKLPPINPHTLQPPFHKVAVRGDIVIMKVAEDKQDMDESEDPENIDISILSNDEFFLNYTKEEYIKFATRTDIEEHEIEPHENEIQEEEDETEYADEEDSEEEGMPYEMGEDGGIEEEDKSAMFNLVMNEVLRQYREEHGRGPNTEELLDLRASIANELDVKVNEVVEKDWSKKAKENSNNSKRRISFHEQHKVLEYHPHPAEHDHHDRNDDDFINEGETEVEKGENIDLDDDEDDDTKEPPSKRLKTALKEDTDAKPAAIETETNSATHQAQAHNASQSM